MSGAKIKMDIKRRMLIILAIFVFVLVLLIVRTAFIQLVQGEDLQKKAVAQQTRDREISSKRGSILDRNGHPLAVSASVETVTASPAIIKENEKTVAIETVAKGLSDILELDFDELLEKLQKNSSYEMIKRKIEKDTADKLREFLDEKDVKGIYLDTDTKRFYPYGSLASHVIGFTGTDNQGLEGIEQVYDKYLKGSPGRIITPTNAAGGDMPFKYEKMVDAKDGLNVVLTIDENIQRFAEKHLETAIEENKLANGAACIIMDPKTGEILAMTSKPDYDLNAPFEITDEEMKKQIEALSGEEKTTTFNEYLQKKWRNKAVADSYEPGSTFKIITSAMALEDNLVSFNDTFYCSGSKRVANYNIGCWKHQGHGAQNFVDGVKNSCNPVFMEIGERIGNARFAKYFRAFGFTEKTGIELPGESSGIFYSEGNFNEVELATSTFGQGPVITPLQLVAAVGAVANGGKLMKPHLVKQLTDTNGNVVKDYAPTFVRQVISESTSKTLCGVLESVVSSGTGIGAYIKGFRVGGKTGTSEKIPRGNQKYIASFVGFAPADAPEVVCLVILDEPTTGVYFGGTIASPVMRSIMDDTLNYLNLKPAYTAEELATLEVAVPNLVGMTVADAKSVLGGNNLKSRAEGAGEKVLNQIPKAGVKVNQQSTITLYTEENTTISKVSVPNLLQKSIDEVSSIVSNTSLNLNIVGVGETSTGGNGVISYKQTPLAGEEVDAGSVITVEFRRTDGGE